MRGKLFLALAASAILAPGSRFRPAAAQETPPSDLKANLDLPVEAPSSGEEGEEPPEIVVFYGQHFEGNAFIFCCKKPFLFSQFKSLQNELIRSLSQLSDRTQFAVIFFDCGIIKFPSSSRPLDATPAMRVAAITFVKSTSPGIGVPMCSASALQHALQYASLSSRPRRAIVFLSDGLNSCPAETVAEISEKNTERVPIHVIYLGYSCKLERWMQELAAQNNGSYTRVVR